MVQLALHWAESTHLPEQLCIVSDGMMEDAESPMAYPTVHLVVLSRSLRVRQLVLLVVPFDQVLQNRATFKNSDGLPIGELISQGRDSTIGINFEIPWLLIPT